MRKRELEILLERVPPHPAPKAHLEQYATPAPIAADLLFRAYAKGDVAGLRVLDLGCGTGIFAIGAALLGASECYGVDADGEAVAAALSAAEALGVDRVRFVEGDVSGFDTPGDTVLENPPFGAQRPGADRAFLDRAVALADVGYSLHLESTRAFVERYLTERGARVTDAWTYAFPLRHQFAFQEKAVHRVPVVALRFER